MTAGSEREHMIPLVHLRFNTVTRRDVSGLEGGNVNLQPSLFAPRILNNTVIAFNAQHFALDGFTQCRPGILHLGRLCGTNPLTTFSPIKYLCLCECGQPHAEEEPIKYQTDEFGKRYDDSLLG